MALPMRLADHGPRIVAPELKLCQRWGLRPVGRRLLTSDRSPTGAGDAHTPE